MTDRFFISDGGEVRGPYEREQLQSMWKAGQVTASTLYCPEASQEWSSSDKLGLALAPAAQPSPHNPARAEKAGGSGVLVVGWVSLALALGVMLAGASFVVVCLPLAAIAALLGIVAIVQKKVGAGVLLVLCAALYVPLAPAIAFGVSRGQEAYVRAKELQEARAAGENTAATVPRVEIIRSDVQTKERRSSGSYLLEWIVRVRNNTDRTQTGQLWLFGRDRENVDRYTSVLDVFSSIPARGELSKAQELVLSPEEMGQITNWKAVWK